MLLQSGSSTPKAPSHSRCSGLWCVLLTALTLLLWAEPAHAYGWMIRHAYGGCASCHADPSGGELLTEYGRLQGALLLRMQYGEKTTSDVSSGEGFDESAFEGFDDSAFDDLEESSEEAPADEGESSEESEESESEESKGKDAAGKEVDDSGEPDIGFMWGLLETPPGLLLGGSYRSLAIYQPGAEDQFTYIPVMMGDLFLHVRADSVRVGATAGISKVKPGSPHARAAQVTHGQGDQYNMVSRTHWVGFDAGANDEYLFRLGRINLPFGVRVPEHTLWAREATRTDRESDQQHGVALAYTGDSFRMEAMGIAGNFQISPDSYRERGYSLYLEYFPTPYMAFGASSMLTFAQTDRLLLKRNVTRQAHGIMGRAALADWLVVLGEADLLMTSGASTGYTGFVQFDTEIIQGLHFMVTGEVLNQGLFGTESPTNPKSPGSGEPRLGGWVSLDWFFYHQFEFRIDLVQRQEADTQLLGQLHFYL